MKILFFGRLSERLGREMEIDLPADVRNVADLRRLLAGLRPEAQSDFLGPSLRACVGDSIVGDDAPVSGASEIAFFPPLSGG
ncbi:MoaD/ThiS family protein [Sphingosinicella sp. CPCC 101087]|uniref:MoaD/ThiS family protein n=1 Tax=Sphingosinicella sp. CPCC 101087 TaxID=2497754 RepID=UPI00101C2F13|nr:MoaD/ThiS family protein [Sphingosinicella sp. CPCC 101087]